MGFSLSDLDPTSSSSVWRRGGRYLDENIVYPWESPSDDSGIEDTAEQRQAEAEVRIQAAADLNPDEFDALLREAMFAKYDAPNESLGLGGTFTTGPRGVSSRYNDFMYQRYTGNLTRQPRAQLTATTRGLSGAYWSR